MSALTKLFKFGDAAAAITALETRITELDAELATAKTALETANTEHAAALAAAQLEVSKRDEQITTLTTERDTATARITTLESEAQTVASAAAKALAGVGIKAEQAPAPDVTATPAAATKAEIDALWAEYSQISATDPDARRKFYVERIQPLTHPKK